MSRLMLNLAVSISAVVLLPYYDSLGLHVTTAPFSLVGIAIAIFLGFRTNTSYARFNEARCLWGMLLITTRSITRQIKSIFNTPEDNQLVAKFLTAFSWSLKHQLRGTDAQADLERLLPEPYLSDVLSSPLRTNRVLLLLGEWLGTQYRAGRISDILFADIDKNLNELAHIQGACERISNTPIPYAYGLILRRTVYLFCTMLPFALVDDLHYMTPLISVFISYTFLSLEYVAEEIEEPFGTAPNDLALDAMCITIEINQLEMNDAAALPAFLKPDENYQLR
jgi:putative membrane protein